MKTALLAAVWFGCQMAAGAQELNELRSKEQAWNARVEVQIVAMPLATALALVPRLREAAGFERAFEEVQAAIMRGRAELLGSPRVLAMSGTRGIAESRDELRYPAEPNFSGYGAAAMERVRGSRHPRHLMARWGAKPPLAYETRLLGSALKAEPVVAEDGRSIAVSLSISEVRLLQTHRHRGHRAPSGSEGSIDLPEFSKVAFTGAAVVTNGKHTFLGMSLEDAPPQRAILFFLRVTAFRPD